MPETTTVDEKNFKNISSNSYDYERCILWHRQVRATGERNSDYW